MINERKGFDRFESTNLFDEWCTMEDYLFDELWIKVKQFLKKKKESEIQN